MDVKELLDDDAFDPKKLFNEEEYNTLIINREGFSKKQNDVADLIHTLLEKNTTRLESEEIFKILKEKNAQEMLVNSIKQCDRMSEKVKLTAACWESCLDFSNHFLFFVELACNNDFALSMEALTVVENCEEPVINQEVLTQALVITKNSKSPNTALLEDLKNNITARIL
ncbi:MAG: hypothetical protein SFY56_00310 [Bacteroidota bacterium]|nr:hypothetical protein [Bacteroidota bacterium]